MTVSSPERQDFVPRIMAVGAGRLPEAATEAAIEIREIIESAVQGDVSDLLRPRPQ